MSTSLPTIMDGAERWEENAAAKGSAGRLRLLIVAPFPVFPLHAGGKIRIVKLARRLGELRLEVTVVAPFHFGQASPPGRGSRFGWWTWSIRS